MGKWLGLVCVAALVACTDPAFECRTDDQCGNGGRCEATGYCSFPDQACASGHRYGALAGAGYAGSCVEDFGGGTDSSPSGGASATETFGPTPDTGEDSLDPTEGSMTGPAESCVTPLECFEAAPPGWEGPILASAAEGDCPAVAPVQGVTVFAGVVAPAATCTCTCDVALACDSVTLYRAGAGCAQGEELATLAEESCLDLDPPTSRVIVEWNTPMDACSGVATTDVAEPAWDTTTTLCAADPSEACGTGKCLPGGGEICIFRNGDHPCPPGAYGERLLHFAALDDARDCEPCECMGGDVDPACVLSAYGDSTCGRLDESITSVQGDCLMGLAGVDSFDVQREGTCEPAGGGGPIGSATGAEPLTLCCGA